jgi:FdhD protein
VRVRVARRDARGATVEEDDQVAVEAPLELRLGGRPLTVLMRTPGGAARRGGAPEDEGEDEDEELARGFLYTEGLIAEARDVVAVTRPDRLVGDEVGNVLDVELRAGRGPVVLERTFYGSSSCGVCGKSSIAALRVRAAPIASRLSLARPLIAALPDRLRAAQPRFAATGGLHASGLFDASGQLVAAREDVGRHNALDKLVGWALRARRLPLADVALAVSGRVSYEILQKAIAAGLPMIVAVGAPSSLAVELAEQFGVTLVGFVRQGGFNVYAGAERVG